MQLISKYIFSIAAAMLVLVLAWVDLWMIVNHSDSIIFLVLLNTVLAVLAYLQIRYLVLLYRKRGFIIRFKTIKDSKRISGPENR
jgi:hypothetical protein